MLCSRPILTALAAAFLTAVCLSADAAPALSPKDDARMAGHGPMSFLTPQERMMLMGQMRSETAGMTDDQRQAHRLEMRAKILKMTAADKQKFAAGLKAKWDALSDSQRAELKRQAQAALRKRQGG